MADLLTHYVAARLPSIGLDRRTQGTLVVGTILPDLVSKGLDLSTSDAWYFAANSHALLGFALIAWLASLLFPRSLRPRAWGALTAGGYIHIFVDLFKDNLGHGSCFLLLPFSTRGFEFGMYEPEEIVLVLPAIAAVALILELAAFRLQPNRYVWK